MRIRGEAKVTRTLLRRSAPSPFRRGILPQNISPYARHHLQDAHSNWL